MAETIELLAGRASSGKPVLEAVQVERVEYGRFRVARSPGLVLGIAAGDLIERHPDGTFTVHERGQNLCVQVFRRDGVELMEPHATRSLAPLGARLDGKTRAELVYTIPVSAGFPAVEAALGDLVARHSGAEWFFGNVYDPADGETPLDWWK